MRVEVNGERHELPPDITLEEAIASLPGAPAGRGVAAALDGEVVPRSQWAAAAVRDGAKIELVVAVQGG